MALALYLPWNGASAVDLSDKRRHWNNETVVRKIQNVFPGSDVSEILAKLQSVFTGAEYARRLAMLDSSDPNAGKSRLYLAIIKLCDEGKGLTHLEHNVNAAKGDWRDVLAWAESPNYLDLPLSASEAERKQAKQLDDERYMRWLERDLK